METINYLNSIRLLKSKIVDKLTLSNFSKKELISILEYMNNLSENKNKMHGL